MPKKVLPKDPRDLYIWSEEAIPLTKLTKIYKGKPACSYSMLKDRSRAEGWVQQRKDHHRAISAKADEKIIEKKSERAARAIADLNQEHDAFVEDLLKISKALLKKYIITKPDGTKEITCDAKEYRALVTTQLDLMKAQRLFHNFDPEKPVEYKAESFDHLHSNPLLEALAETVEADWEELKALTASHEDSEIQQETETALQLVDSEEPS